LLCDADAVALDVLVERAMMADDVPAPHRERASRAATLLSLLDAGRIEGRDGRISRVMAGVRQREREIEWELCGDDAEALDAWVLAGFDCSKVAGSLRPRARAHEAMADLVSTSGAGWTEAERTDLVERTLARAEAANEHDEQTYRFRPVASRVRWSDLLSVAAVLLIGASVLWPVFSTVRDGARRAICEANMLEVSRAFGGYSMDNDEMLPMVTAGFGSAPWWDVGHDPRRSNSANLYALARERYVGLEALACPGNPDAITAPRSPDARDWARLEELSYSYRVMAAPERELWGQPDQLVLVADRSPVILRAVRGQTVYPFESSPNHGGRGQHGLLADGSARWMESPVLASGDNIWLPKPIEIVIDVVSRRAGIEPLQGTEAPADRQDSFVGP
jgi:hypothetical protein